MWLLIGVGILLFVTFFVPQRLLPLEQAEHVFREFDSLPDVISSMTPTPRRNRSIPVSIVSVVSSNTSLEQYEMAITSVECYAATHGYRFFVINDSKYANVCDQEDVGISSFLIITVQAMFRRHCVVAEFLEATQPGEWLLFIDADVMVVNPNRLIEEWIDQDHDVILYDRFYNWEVAAGSYLVRHSRKALRFLRAFAGYEFRLPSSFHGTDNGALTAANVPQMDNEHFVNPLVGQLDRDECAGGRVAWRYRDASLITREERAERLSTLDAYVRRLQLRFAGSLDGSDRETEESTSTVSTVTSRK